MANLVTLKVEHSFHRNGEQWTPGMQIQADPLSAVLLIRARWAQATEWSDLQKIVDASRQFWARADSARHAKPESLGFRLGRAATAAQLLH